MGEYGTVFTVNNAKRQMLEQNRDVQGNLSWKNMFAYNDLNAARAQELSKVDYASSVNQAYTAYLQNQNLINNSGIVGSGRQLFNNENAAALQSAYDTFMQRRQADIDAITSGHARIAQGIDDELAYQAQNVVDYQNSHFDYLQYLYDTYRHGDNDPFEDEMWRRYIITDEYGDERLMTKEELSMPKANELDDGTLEWESLFDDKGNLTFRGVDFFDQMQNQFANEQNRGITSFGRYLAENNPELYEWSKTYNPYNYTEAGTNQGTFKTMVGMTSTDADYAFAERMGGLSSGQIKELYSDFANLTSSFDELDASKDASKIVKQMKETTDELFGMLQQLGIDDDLREVGVDENLMNTIFVEATNAIKSNKKMNNEWWSSVLISAGAGALIGGTKAATATSVTNVIPVAGTAVNIAATIIGTIGGFLIGGGIGMFGATSTQNRQKELNKATADNTKILYDQMVNELINYSLHKRRQAEIDFYNQYGK